MKTKIGIGIISFAHGHANAYCSQMQTFDDVELVACWDDNAERCLLYTSPSPRDRTRSRMPSSA